MSTASAPFTCEPQLSPDDALALYEYFAASRLTTLAYFLKTRGRNVDWETAERQARGIVGRLDRIAHIDREEE